MQIPVQVKRESGQITEWIIVELQGTLETTGQHSLAGQLVGDLTYMTDGTPVLIIGHHALTGKEVTLDAPLGVLVKSPKTTDDTEQSLTMTALVKRKIVFKNRPKPIVTNVPKKV